MDLIARIPTDIMKPGDILRNPSGALEGEMVKMSKNDNFCLTFFNFEKNRLSQFCIKLHQYIHCHIHAVINETCQDELSITKRVPFCLADGQRQLTRGTKSEVSCLQTLLMRRNEDLQMTFGVGRHTTLIVNIPFKTSIFLRIGKKDNQSLVSGADQEIPTLGSKDNAGNSVNLVSGITPLT